MDNYVTLYNRLLSRCPAVGEVLSQQLINDSWRTLQAKSDWSWRRRSFTFAPPNLYQTGTATTNVGAGNPTLITGVGTAWTASMIGSQIRIGGLLYPYYTIVGWQSPTAILIDSPWAGPDVTGQVYQILQCYFPVPADFGHFYLAVSIKDGYRIYTTITEAELGLLDPQRTNTGQTYAFAYKDTVAQFGGIVGPIIPVGATGATPISTTATGFSYVANATYIIQIVGGGASGVATFQWMRAGQVGFTGPIVTDVAPITLIDGVQIYFPVGTYNANDLFIINCQSLITQGVPRYEAWPAPTFNGYLYPCIYIAKEYDLTPQNPSLPPFVANRGEILLEMALEKCATYPGPDTEHPNPYYDLRLAELHRRKVDDMMIEFGNADQDVGVELVGYQNLSYAGPFAGPFGVFYDGAYQQSHGPTF